MTKKYAPGKLRNQLQRRIIINDLCCDPVIFANGRDDDTMGFSAAIENRRVVLDGRTYEPGEPMDLSCLTMFFACGRIIINQSGAIWVIQPKDGFSPLLGRTLMMKVPRRGRSVTLEGMATAFGLTIQP